MFLNGYFKRSDPLYKRTIESLTAQISYKSLLSINKEYAKEFGVFSGALNPIFFHLSPQELSEVELSLPPYPLIMRHVYEKLEISGEDLKLSEAWKELASRKIYNLPLVDIIFATSSRLKKDWREMREANERVNNKIITEEFREILDGYSQRYFSVSRKTMIPVYGITALSFYLKTFDLGIEVAYLLSILTYNFLSSLKYGSNEKRKRLSKISFPIRAITSSSIGAYIYSKTVDLPLIATYFFTVFLPSYLEAGIEYKEASKVGELIEKAWPYLPKIFRKVIESLDAGLWGRKIDQFDERDIREELYEASKNIKTSLPNGILEEFRRRLEDGVSIQIENPSEKLVIPFALGYHRRKIILEKEGEEWKIRNKEYIRRLAQKCGMFVQDFEREIEKRPGDFLVLDFKGEKPVYCVDVIGMYNFENEGLRKGVAFKEAEACLLGLRANELVNELYSR